MKADKVLVACPKCGHTQHEPASAYSSVCKKCRQYFRLEEVLRASATNAAHPRPVAMLQHERRVNLFIQGRRLWDHYRFGVPSDQWAVGSEALTKPGTLLPITITELQSNPCIVSPGSC